MLVLLNNDAEPQLVSRVPQGDARREHVLRDLIHDHPSILPVHDLDPSFGRLFTGAPEFDIPGVGFVDVLLADERGRLVVVECKLWRNPQARREVVGQILDYARELSRWGYEDLQRQISIASGRQGNALFAMARDAGSDMDEASFVDRVSRDLAAGRFLLLIVGDGITEGTRRIGEYLQGQPGLAFTFGLIELAEYRHGGPGNEQVIVQPRVVAQTTVIERHVIRSEVAGIAIDAVAPTSAAAGNGASAPSEANLAWRRFADRLIGEMQFDDPGQPPPRSGGTGWLRVPLLAGLYVNVYRAASEGGLGAQVRFAGSEGAVAWGVLSADRMAIDTEFAAAGLAPPQWHDGEVPVLALTQASPLPWNDAVEDDQRRWMARVANQFINSLRPRLQGVAREPVA